VLLEPEMQGLPWLVLLLVLLEWLGFLVLLLRAVFHHQSQECLLRWLL
jgi:hypothetical protein